MTDRDALLESICAGLRITPGVAMSKTEELHWLRGVVGGDINQAALIGNSKQQWFVKYHQNAPADMFRTEAQALTEITGMACIRVPSPIAYGISNNTSWLVLEYLQLSSHGQASQLGEQLAALHQVRYDSYGWPQDNYIGRNRQCNTTSNSWSQFWRERRLGPQLEMAKAGGFGGKLINNGEKLLDSMDQLMDGHQPPASLLHGDLWAGNMAFTSDGQPVIFDPASYHGDRETDIAMTELFGGFEPDFYAAYQAHARLPDGYRLRRDLYNLYHVLNHLNLFGRAYLARCDNMISALLAQIR